jgi:hypothetical protein
MTVTMILFFPFMTVPVGVSFLQEVLKRTAEEKESKNIS